MFIPDQLPFILLTIAFTIAFGLFYGYLHLSVTAKLAKLDKDVAELHNANDRGLVAISGQTDLVHRQLSGINSIVDLLHVNLAELRDQIRSCSHITDFREQLQQFIQSQYGSNRDIITAMQAVDSRMERYIQLLQGCPPDEDESPLVEKPNLADLVTPLYQVRDIVEAFKNDLITQVRLSREDYEELMTAAESKGELLPQQLNDLRLALGTLQAQLADFRIEFHQITGS